VTAISQTWIDCLKRFAKSNLLRVKFIRLLHYYPFKIVEYSDATVPWIFKKSLFAAICLHFRVQIIVHFFTRSFSPAKIIKYSYCETFSKEIHFSCYRSIIGYLLLEPWVDINDVIINVDKKVVSVLFISLFIYYLWEHALHTVIQK